MNSTSPSSGVKSPTLTAIPTLTQAAAIPTQEVAQVATATLVAPTAPAQEVQVAQAAQEIQAALTEPQLPLRSSTLALLVPPGMR